MSRKDSVIEETHHRPHHEPHAETAAEAPPETKPPASAETTKTVLPASDEPLVKPYASLPPLLGKAPTSFRQMMTNIPGTKASHFTGPLVSGPVPGGPFPAGPQGPQVAGVAPLALTLMLDYTMGNFIIPLPFPPGSFVYSWMSIAFTAFNASPGPVAFTMGTQPSLTDIFSNGSFGSAGGEIDQNITGSLPLWNAVAPLVPFQGWLNVTGMLGGTAGQGLIVLFYFRLPQAWS